MIGELQGATDARAFVDGETVELPDMQFLLGSVTDCVRDVSRGRRRVVSSSVCEKPELAYDGSAEIEITTIPVTISPPCI